MLEVKLRQIADQELVNVSLAALAVSTRGEFRFPAAEAEGTSSDGRPSNRVGPAVIVQCMDRHDAMACLEFASRQGVLVAVGNAPGDPATWRDCDQGMAVVLPASTSRQARLAG